MRNSWNLFKADIKRIGSNIITIMLIVGLVMLPSLFSWFNLLACWNVFNNTDELRVAVANTDDGYKSDLIPLRVNMGDQVIAALRANDQLDWEFTTEEDAIDGARSGKYYAAVVIPPSFSKDLMSFYSPDIEHASILYYTNQKLNALAPKLTMIGTDQVSNEVNHIFEDTLAELALGTSKSLMDYFESSGDVSLVGDLADHMTDVADQLDDGALALQTYALVLGSGRNLVESTGKLIEQTDASASQIEGAIQESEGSTAQALSALQDATGQLSTLVSGLTSNAGEAESAIDKAFDQQLAAANQAQSALTSAASLAEAAGNPLQAEQLRNAAKDIKTASDQAQATRGDIEKRMNALAQSTAQTQTDYEQNLKPKLDELMASFKTIAGAIDQATAALHGIAADLSSSVDSLAADLSSGENTVNQAADDLTKASDELDGLGERLIAALASGNLEEIRSIIGNDPAKFAEHLTAPIALERIAVYEVDGFGSAMAPLYTSLALWVGALLTMVALRPSPTPAELRTLRNPTPQQIFFGRFMTIGSIALLQSTFLALGNLLFIGVQADNPLLYLLCFWVSGLTFTFILYALVALFGNLGKMLGVILLVLQIAGGGGSYPLSLLPKFTQDISPLLPLTHAVNAMRAAMFGLYQGDFWIQLGTLLLFAVPLLLLAIFLLKPLQKVVTRFVEQIEKSKLM